MKRPRLFLLLLFLLITNASFGLVPHPRLLVTEADWKSLPARMEAEPVVMTVIANTVERADFFLKAKPLTYKLQGRRMLSVSREAIERVLHLATAWKVTGEKKYFLKCRENLLTVSAFEDWHPPHHLDTAEMQTAVAIGYDWLFQELSTEDRNIIATALLEKGLKSTLANESVMRRNNNWNQVCNAGIILSALALEELEPELCSKAIKKAEGYLHIALRSGYSPDGAYAEGGGYWEYGTIFSVLTLEALRKTGRPDPGIATHKGFLESGAYVAQVYGSTKRLFNYGDSNEGDLSPSPAAAWMARENQSAVQRERLLPAFLKTGKKPGGRFYPLAAFWFPLADEVKVDALPLHFVGGGNSPIALHRSGFEKNDLFLGIKAGMAGANHSHMDAGSFVLELDGERWASDLGSQNYHSLEQRGINLFRMTQDSGRWKVFRLNNFSHNTLTLNGQLHQMDGYAKILSSNEKRTEVSLTAPLGLAKGAEARRVFVVDAAARTVEVTDSLEGLKPGDEVRWNLMTRAKVTEREGGFLLSKNSKSLLLDLSAGSAKPVASPADPPPADYDATNENVTMLRITEKADKKGKVTIRAFFHQK